MAKPEEFSPGDIDLSSLHTDPEPDDVVKPTPDVVAAAKVASAINLPPSPAGGNTPDNQDKKTGRQKKGVPARVATQTGAGQPPAKPTATPLPGPQAHIVQPAAAPTLAKATAKATSQPAVPKTVERAKTVEQRTEAIAEYVKGVQTGNDLIQKILNMPNDATLKARGIGFKKLSGLSAEIYDKVIDFFREFEELKNAPATTVAMLDAFGKTFIATLNKGDLAGFQPALRSVVYQDVKNRLFPSAPAGASAQTPKGQMTVDEFLGPAKPAGGASASGAAEVSGTPEASSRAERWAEFLRKHNPRTAPVTETRVETPLAPPSAGTPPEISEAAERRAEFLRKANPREEQTKNTPEKSTTAAEQIPLATFEDLARVNQDTLEKALAVGTPRAWGRAMSGFAENPKLLSFVQNVRAFFAGDKTRVNEFDTGLMYVESDQSLKVLRNFLLSQARRALEQETHLDTKTSSSESEGKSATVPLVITRDMEQQLADKGLDKEARNKLTPAEAWEVINGKKEGVTETLARKAESLSTADKIGRAFIHFAQFGRFDEEEFLQDLKASGIPNAQVRSVFRPTGAQELYFSETREGSALKCFLVTVGGENYLVPTPANKEKFETIQGFEIGADASPATLEQFTPAEVVQNGTRWEIKDKGRMNKPPAERGEQLSIEETLAKKAESLAQAEKIGEVFVRFCRTQTKEFPISSFLKMLVETIPGATVAEVYRSSGAQTGDIYFTRTREASPQRYWLVTIGARKFILPKPVKPESFDDGNNPKGFSKDDKKGEEDYEGKVSPNSLTKFLPAEVSESGKRIEIRTQGWFNEPTKQE
ncbi:MAG: hypothetical protein UY50_C0022G0009 [Parcubacteria group bacterium GW2011_GWA2_49_9]|nr:MAG: hypothetical protein UY50_C0022G0009 [Parcubacteria group bacterium GW2011_GWA2_49_9]